MLGRCHFGPNLYNMSTPTKAASNAAAIAAQTAIFAIGNQKFIDEATLRIADAVSQGHFKQLFYTTPNVNLTDIFDYFQALNYKVKLPDCPTFWCQPAQLFGDEWEDFWEGKQVCRCKKSCKVLISWK